MKLSDKIERKIENLIDTKTISHLSEPKSLGRVKRLEDGNEKYIQILKNISSLYHQSKLISNRIRNSILYAAMKATMTMKTAVTLTM